MVSLPAIERLLNLSPQFQRVEIVQNVYCPDIDGMQLSFVFLTVTARMDRVLFAVVEFEYRQLCQGVGEVNFLNLITFFVIYLDRKWLFFQADKLEFQKRSFFEFV